MWLGHWAHSIQDTGNSDLSAAWATEHTSLPKGRWGRVVGSRASFTSAEVLGGVHGRRMESAVVKQRGCLRGVVSGPEWQGAWLGSRSWPTGSKGMFTLLEAEVEYNS